jgi:hypothetical protein
MRYWRTFYKKSIIEGISGNYEVWAEKTIADNMVIFRAKQVSIVHKGQNWNVNDRIYDRLRICEATNLSFSAYVDGDVISPIPIEEYELQFNHFSESTWFNPHLRYQFQAFCRKIYKVPLNEARRVR